MQLTDWLRKHTVFALFAYTALSLSALAEDTAKEKIDETVGDSVPFKSSNFNSQRMENGNWGYVDSNGKEVISPYFQDAEDFSDGLGQIKLNDKWGYIDTKGDVVIQPQFDESKAFSEGLAPVCQDDKWAYIDKQGKLITQFKSLLQKGFMKDSPL